MPIVKHWAAQGLPAVHVPRPEEHLWCLLAPEPSRYFKSFLLEEEFCLVMYLKGCMCARVHCCEREKKTGIQK